MSFTPDEIDRMSPAIIEEIQEREVRKDSKARDFRASGLPERRRTHKGQGTRVRGNGWARVWNVHDPDQAYLREVRKGAQVAAQEGVS